LIIDAKSIKGKFKNPQKINSWSLKKKKIAL